MNLIIETDIGHDPDDFFAICYLIAAGEKVRAITVSPGDPDQIAIAKFIVKETGLDIPVGASKLKREKLSSGSIHHDLLDKYKLGRVAVPDGYGMEVVENALQNYPDSELFVIGPVSSVGRYLRDHPDTIITKATMQGGFLGYHQHSFPCVKLDKFEGCSWQPTFNLNGDREAAKWFLDAKIEERRFVSKNVCHTVLYNKEQHQQVKPKNRASELFKEAGDLYFARHEEKKFHDPTAAVCHLHPEIAYWARGKITKMESGWGTVLDDCGDYVIAGIDYNQLWNHIYNFT